MRAASFLKSTGFEYWIGVSSFFKFSFGGIKGQVIRVSLFDTVEKRFGVKKHLLFSLKNGKSGNTHKPFNSCLEDDPFNDQDHHNRPVSKL